MRRPLKLTVIGRSKGAIATLEDLLSRQPGVTIAKRLLDANDGRLLDGAGDQPDVLVYDLGEQWREELEVLAAVPAPQRPPVIVVGPADDMQVMRQAMRAGARDFFARPVSQQELTDAVRAIHQERLATGGRDSGQLNVMINAKGGSGASTLAVNIAHIMAALLDQRTALVDFDVQFGALPLYLDLKPEYTIQDVLDAGQHLDSVSIGGFMTKHPSGLHVLGVPHDMLMLPAEIPAPVLERLLTVLRENYQQSVLDLPRQIDPLTGFLLEHADRILLVVQQSVNHLRDAARLLSILTRELGLERERVRVLINRFDSKNNISAKDVEKSLSVDGVVTVPSDFRRVSESVDLGIPLYDGVPKAAITKALIAIAMDLCDMEIKRTGLFGRVYAAKNG